MRVRVEHPESGVSSGVGVSVGVGVGVSSRGGVGVGGGSVCMGGNSGPRGGIRIPGGNEGEVFCTKVSVVLWGRLISGLVPNSSDLSVFGDAETSFCLLVAKRVSRKEDVPDDDEDVLVLLDKLGAEAEGWTIGNCALANELQIKHNILVQVAKRLHFI